MSTPLVDTGSHCFGRSDQYETHIAAKRIRLDTDAESRREEKKEGEHSSHLVEERENAESRDVPSSSGNADQDDECIGETRADGRSGNARERCKPDPPSSSSSNSGAATILRLLRAWLKESESDAEWFNSSEEPSWQRKEADFPTELGGDAGNANANDRSSICDRVTNLDVSLRDALVQLLGTDFSSERVRLGADVVIPDRPPDGTVFWGLGTRPASKHPVVKQAAATFLRRPTSANLYLEEFGHPLEQLGRIVDEFMCRPLAGLSAGSGAVKLTAGERYIHSICFPRGGKNWKTTSSIESCISSSRHPSPVKRSVSSPDSRDVSPDSLKRNTRGVVSGNVPHIAHAMLDGRVILALPHLADLVRVCRRYDMSQKKYLMLALRRAFAPLVWRGLGRYFNLPEERSPIGKCSSVLRKGLDDLHLSAGKVRDDARELELSAAAVLDDPKENSETIRMSLLSCVCAMARLISSLIRATGSNQVRISEAIVRSTSSMAADEETSREEDEGRGRKRVRRSRRPMSSRESTSGESAVFVRRRRSTSSSSTNSSSSSSSSSSGRSASSSSDVSSRSSRSPSVSSRSSSASYRIAHRRSRIGNTDTGSAIDGDRYARYIATLTTRPDILRVWKREMSQCAVSLDIRYARGDDSPNRDDVDRLSAIISEIADILSYALRGDARHALTADDGWKAVTRIFAAKRRLERTGRRGGDRRGHVEGDRLDEPFGMADANIDDEERLSPSVKTVESNGKREAERKEIDHLDPARLDGTGTIGAKPFITRPEDKAKHRERVVGEGTRDDERTKKKRASGWKGTQMGSGKGNDEDEEICSLLEKCHGWAKAFDVDPGAVAAYKRRFGRGRIGGAIRIDEALAWTRRIPLDYPVDLVILCSEKRGAKGHVLEKATDIIDAFVEARRNLTIKYAVLTTRDLGHVGAARMIIDAAVADRRTVVLLDARTRDDATNETPDNETGRARRASARDREGGSEQVAKKRRIENDERDVGDVDVAEHRKISRERTESDEAASGKKKATNKKRDIDETVLCAKTLETLPGVVYIRKECVRPGKFRVGQRFLRMLVKRAREVDPRWGKGKSKR
ncbi:regulatory protein [Psittacid alphaherpesvirus 5]|uniref:Regulatory protein n=1 Tax=Psittacid alphaherpesvirus 5 TaxID=2972693 RepID=A0A5P9JSF3_9ALPH|nr:regulatory protein [Psittacid alphaherpesvirus 5]QFU14606.1 regulatory protein [Psittacid alphaherpesvirus 5]